MLSEAKWEQHGTAAPRSRGKRAIFKDSLRGNLRVMALADAWNAWDDKPAKNNTRASVAHELAASCVGLFASLCVPPRACPEITSIAGTRPSTSRGCVDRAREQQSLREGSRKFMALPEGWVWLAGVGQSAVYAVSGGGRQRCHCEHGCRACRAQADIKISGVNAETRLASRQLGLFFWFTTLSFVAPVLDSNVFGRLAGELIRI